MSHLQPQPHKLKNIYIIGPQSTGKTTLVTALTSALSTSPIQQPYIVSEVARTVLHEHHFTREDILTSPIRALQLQKHILSAQHHAETSIPPSSWYVSDRSGLDPIVYARLFVSPEASKDMLELEEWLELGTRMKDGVVFLCEAGGEWLVDDGTRLMPRDGEEWRKVEEGFREVLEEKEIEFVVLGRDLGVQERVGVVRGVIGV